MKLSNPIPNGKMSNSMLSKTVEISSYNSDTIFSPAQGTVVVILTTLIFVTLTD